MTLPLKKNGMPQLKNKGKQIFASVNSEKISGTIKVI